MNIVHIVLGKANPNRMNGVNKVVNDLARHQTLAGHCVELWGITKSLIHDYPTRPYTTRLFRAGRYLFSVDPSLEKSIAQLSKDSIVHLHGGFIPDFFPISKILHRNDIRFVFTPHGSYNLVALNRNTVLKQLYWNLFERKLIKHAKVVHCLGKSEMLALDQLLPSAKTALVPYGFETTRTASTNNKDRFIIGYCGRIDIYTKGLDTLLTAFALFAAEHKKAELWIIGDGEERIELEELAEELNITRNISFLGALYGDEKFEALQEMHAFAHPSRNEGLPTAVMEASSLGIPCIVTEATNIGDAVAAYDAGIVISTANVADLKDAMVKLYHRITNGEETALKNNCETMIREFFNWKRVIKAFDQMYAEF